MVLEELQNNFNDVTELEEIERVSTMLRDGWFTVPQHLFCLLIDWLTFAYIFFDRFTATARRKRQRHRRKRVQIGQTE
jgi:hypothetical protein